MTDERDAAELAEELDVSLPDTAPSSRPYDPEPARDRLRGWLAVALLAMLAVVVAAAWVSLWWSLATEAEIKDLLGVILPPIVALVGSAIGFYFGGKPATK